MIRGQYGTLEAYSGGKSLVRHCQGLLDAGHQSLLQDMLQEGNNTEPSLNRPGGRTGGRVIKRIDHGIKPCVWESVRTL